MLKCDRAVVVCRQIGKLTMVVKIVAAESDREAESPPKVELDPTGLRL
jgi:hypothetical protein